MTAGLELRSYQKDGVQQLSRFLKQRGAGYLADDMGLGKTAQAATLARGAKTVLVVCPANLRINWARELRMWAPDLEPALPIEDNKQAKYITMNPVVVVSYKMVINTKVLERLVSCDWDFIIFDESHALKNHEAKRTEACLQYLWPRGKYKLCISGTPVPNGALDGFTLFNKIAPDLFPNVFQYREQFCQKKYNPMIWNKRTRKRGGYDYYGGKNLDELRSLVRGNFMVRRKKSDVAKELPEKIYSKVYLDIGKKPAEISLSSADIENFESMMAEGNELIKSDHMMTVRRGTGVLKVPAGLKYISESFGEKKRLVIFAHHRDVIKALAEGLTESGDWDRVATLDGSTSADAKQEVIDDFQSEDNKRKVLIGQIQAAGVGITLTRADTCVFFELPWTAADLGQAMDRLHRIGQTETVFVYYLLAEETIDEYMIRSLASKIDITNQVMR